MGEEEGQKHLKQHLKLLLLQDPLKKKWGSPKLCDSCVVVVVVHKLASLRRRRRRRRRTPNGSVGLESMEMIKTETFGRKESWVDRKRRF